MNEYLSLGDKQWLLSNIDQEKVWSNIIGSLFKLGQKIINPLRDDKHLGSCHIEKSNKNNNLVLIDFADSKTNGFDCVSAYRYLHPHKSWSEVCSDLLGMAQVIPTSAYKVLPGIDKVRKNEFVPIYRDWLDSDLEWWERRGVTLDQLQRNITLTKPVCGYIHKRDNKESEIHFSEQCYCYHYQTKHKFYFPNRKDWRFIGNMSKDDIWTINRGSDTLFITKSHKDLLVIENLCDFDITMIQSETNYPSKDKFFEWECYYKQVIVCMDNDDTGRRIAKEIQKQFLYIPSKVIEIEPDTGFKDFDEFRVKEGLTESIDYLNYLWKDI